MKLKAKNALAFTLIELLVVIAIIGILSAAILVAINPSKRSMQARDAQRKNDIGAITNALISYEAITSKLPDSLVFYPPPTTGCDRSNGSLSSCAFPPGETNWSPASGIYLALVQSQQLLKKLPVDPINNTTYYYWYHMQGPSSAPTGYWIGGRLEAPQNSANPIYRCSDWSTLPKGCMEVSNFLQ